MIMLSLLVQKSSNTPKSNEHQLPLERQLDLLKNGGLQELLLEGKPIEKLFKIFQKPSRIAEISRKFKQLMQKGNMNAALNLLMNNMGRAILPLDQQTISQLVLKLPQKSSASKDVLINGPLEKFHPIRFESVNEKLIKIAAVTRAVPSGIDADEWQRIPASNSFSTDNRDL